MLQEELSEIPMLEDALSLQLLKSFFQPKLGLNRIILSSNMIFSRLLPDM